MYRSPGNARPRPEAEWDRSPAPPAAASDAGEREFRQQDDEGDAGGAFNVGVVLHQSGDLAGAKAAYERAEQRGDPDAAFVAGNPTNHGEPEPLRGPAMQSSTPRRAGRTDALVHRSAIRPAPGAVTPSGVRTVWIHAA